MRIALIGFGKMGKMVAALAPEKEMEVTAIVDRQESLSLPHIHHSLTLTSKSLAHADIVIEFAESDGILERIECVTAEKKPFVIGTTGWDNKKKEAEKIVQKNKGTVIASPNFSIGVALFFKLTHYVGTLFSSFPEYASSIVEWHHSQKKDSPSGTALKMKGMLPPENPEVPIASIRSGNYPGTHELLFDSPHDTVSLMHTARNREGFARGALEAGLWVRKKKGWFTIEDLIEEKVKK